MVQRIFTKNSPISTRHTIEQFFSFVALIVPFLLILGRGVADVSMGVVSLAFLVFSWRDRQWSWVKTPWFLVALATWAYLLVAGVFAEFDQSGALYSAAVWMRFPLFTMAFSTWVLPKPGMQKHLSSFLIALLVLVSIDTLWQFAFDMSLSLQPKPDYPGRLTGPFHRLVVGVFLLRVAWPGIGHGFAAIMQRTQNKLYLLLPMLVIALIGLAILVSGERVVFVLFGLCCVLFLLGAKQMRGMLAAVGAIGAVLAVAIVMLSPSLHHRLVLNTANTLDHLSDSAYGAVWANGITAWRYAPIMGVGPNNFVPMCETLGKESGFLNEKRSMTELHCTRHPHNIYLEWLAETGLIGLGFFLGLIVLWIRHAWRALRDPYLTLPDYYIRLGYLIGLVPFFWPIMSSMSFFSNWSAILFWWIIGLVLQQKQQTFNKKIEGNI